MIVVVVAVGKFELIRHILNCAVKRSGCPVYCISEIDWKIGTHVPMEKHRARAEQFVKSYDKCDEKLHKNHWHGLERWFVLSSFLKELGGKEPVFMCDWDVFITRNLNESMKHLLHLPLAAVGNQASYGIFDRNALELFLRYVEDYYAVKPEFPKTSKQLADMTHWSKWRTANSKQYPCGWMEIIHEGSVFDANLYLRHSPPGGGFEADREFYAPDPDCSVEYDDGRTLFAKKIEVVKGNPYFVMKRIPEVKILANTIHCWHGGRKKIDIPRIAKLLGIA